MKPNGETFISLAYACAGVGLPQLGKQLHAYLIINGWHCAEHYDGRLPKSLIHMYSKFGIMDYAHYIFLNSWKGITVQSCNSIIIGYIHDRRWSRETNKAKINNHRDTKEFTWFGVQAYVHGRES